MAKQDEQGQRLLAAVERLVDDPDGLIAGLDEVQRTTPREPGATDEEHRSEVAEGIVSRFSTKCAVSGGVAALPAMLPGAGTLVSVLGGSLADMCMTLKYEVEMALTLTHLYGFDIRIERERQLAFLLASVSTYEASTNRSIFVELAMAETEAIWKYTPRQISKFLLTVMAKLALIAASKSFVRALPVVGVVVGSGVNKLLTTRVGHQCVGELDRRSRLEPRDVDTEVVEARFEE